MKTSDPNMEMIVVDRSDKVIGFKKRAEVTAKDIYRVSALWITNEKNEILLSKRASTKSHDPGRWGTAVAGTVEKGETYSSNIIKEAAEELGLHNIEPKRLRKELIQGKWNFFCQWFTLSITKAQKLVLNKQEVTEVRWITKEQALNEEKANPSVFTPSFGRILKNLFK